MELRRPLFAFVVALALVGGGGLTACGDDPASGNTGTPKDTASNTSGGSSSNDSESNSDPENSEGAGEPAN